MNLPHSDDVITGLLRLSELLEGNTEAHTRRALDEILRVARADAALVLYSDQGFYRPRLWAGEVPPPLRQIFEEGISPKATADIIASLGTDFQVFDHGDHLLVPSMRSVGVRAALVLGLNADDQLEALVLHRLHRPEGWGEAEAALLRLAARTLGAVITRVERARQLEARNRELEIVAQVSQALNQVSNLEAAAEVLTRQVVGLTGADYASLKVVTSDGGGLRNVLAEGFSALTGDVVARGVGLSWQALEQRQTLVAQDALADPRVHIPPVLGEMRWPGSVAQMPMFDPEGTPLGVLGLGYLEKGRVKESDLRTMEIVASIASSTLVRLRADAELSERNRHLEVVAQVGQALNRASSLEEASLELTRQVVELSGADQAFVLLTTPDGSTLRNVLAYGLESFTGFVVPPGRGLTWLALETREIQSTQDARSDPRVYVPGEMQTEKLPRAVGYMPLFDAQERPLGVLGLGYWEPGRFKASDVRTLEIVASIAANTFERLRADEFLRSRNRELQTVVNLSEALKRAMSHEEVTQITLEQTLALTHSRSAVMLTQSPDGSYLLPIRSVGSFTGWQPIPRPQGLAWESWQSRDMRVTADALSEAGVFNPGGFPDLPRSRATVPLFGFDRQVVAVLGVTRDEAGGFTPEELKVFRLIGEVVSSALERVEATAQLMRQLHETQVLFNTLKAVVEPESETVWSDLLRAAVDLVPGVEAGSLLVRDQGEYVMMAHFGYGDELLGSRMNPQIEKYWFGPEDELRRGRARIGRRDFFSAVLQQDQRYLDPELLERFRVYGKIEQLQCSLCVPILSEGELVAYINLDNLTDEMAIGQESVQVAQRFAVQVAALVAARRQRETLETTYEEALRTIAIALEARDPQTAAHTQRVTRLALSLGEAVGLSPQQLFNLRWGAYLHDIGKLAVPDAILLKPGSLTPLERARFARHATEGEALTRQLSFLPEGARSVIRHHHERWDGSGYPDGLAGEAIPLEARIFAVCDVFDALLSQRPYKPALTLLQACAELRECAQSGHLDPYLVGVFLGLVPELYADGV
ncbi:MAG: GAF domain-containing protein [Meiothermus sp.]|nr:GAF domain-containing protein [Meiothermus sp.]